MVSSNTFHVVTTELTVGAFAMAGLSFMLAGLSSRDVFGLKSKLSSLDTVAHAVLLFGLIAMPFAIFSGIQSGPQGDIDHPLLVNKMLLSTTSLGLALGVLVTRRRIGMGVWEQAYTRDMQALGGMASSGLILLTASIGGTYSRGESLLDIFHLPYDTVPLMPLWMSGMVLVIALANLRTALQKA
jgi:hypothetical protein